MRVTVESLKWVDRGVWGGGGRRLGIRGVYTKKHVRRYSDGNARSPDGVSFDVSPVVDQEIGPPFVVLSRVKL